VIKVIDSGNTSQTIKLAGLDCPDCAAKLEQRISKLPGVSSAQVHFAASKLTVSSSQPLEIIIRTIKEAGYDVATEVPKTERTKTSVIRITDLDCPDCAAKLEKRIAAFPGIISVKLNFATTKLVVEHTSSLEKILEEIAKAGQTAEVEGAEADFQTAVFRLGGLDCMDCAAKLEQRLKAAAGIQEAAVNFGAAKLTVTHHLTTEAIVKLVTEAGYEASLDTNQTAAHKQTKEGFLKTNQRLITSAASGITLLIAWILSAQPAVPKMAIVLLYVFTMLAGGFWTFRRGFSALKAGIFDMNVLMTIAVSGAAIIGEWFEGASVAFLYSVSNLLESYTMEKTRQSIRSLMEIAPKEALVRRDGAEISLPVAEIQIDDLVIVKPGEKIAVDGVVSAGISTVNQAPITGESLPVEKTVDDAVYAGTINQYGALEIRVTKLAADSTLAKIIHLVEEAQAGRAPSQAFVDKFARYYTPAVMIGAVGLALIPPLFLSQPWSPWIYRALALIVVACPCALVISTPVAIVAAIGNAAKNGVLIKGGVYLEEAGSLSVIAFDKTGTLTEGRPEVTDIIPLVNMAEEKLLAIAAAIEARSEHPLAEAIVRKAEHEKTKLPTTELFESLSGKGAKARIDAETYYIGNLRLFQELGFAAKEIADKLNELQKQGKTTVILGNDQGLLGIIAVTDAVRDESKEAIRELHTAGIKKIAMLTGDNRDTARAIAAGLGVDEFEAGLLPQEKVAAIQRLAAKYGKVAMVGDGINDAPALATATVGIAMGAAGTDTALETADIVLMSDDLSKVRYTMALSRKTLRIIKQNIGFSLILKAILVIIIFPGWLSLWMAVLGDMGASILVTLNGLRLAGKRV
jgi:Cd2+/Zn2+-exporting ATPase